VFHSVGVCIEGEDLTSCAQQMHKIPPIPAPGIQHPHTGPNIAAQDLIEDVDVDLTKLLLNA
jgi:hypothetical protein